MTKSVKMERLYQIYKILHKSFGPQGWWPASVPQNVLTACPHPPRFPRGTFSQREKEPPRPAKAERGVSPRCAGGRGEGYLKKAPPLEVIIGAILTQNTNWKNVEKAIINLKAKGMLSAKAINNASPAEIEELIRPSGYFRQKTKKLKIFCKYFIENYDRDIKRLFKGNLMKKRNELLSLHGIGKETADSILLYAGNKKIFVVDAYTRRLLERLGFDHIKDYDEIRPIFEKSIPKNVSIYKEFHALIVELAKRYCFKKNPNCGECRLKVKCAHALYS